VAGNPQGNPKTVGSPFCIRLARVGKDGGGPVSETTRDR